MGCSLAVFTPMTPNTCCVGTRAAFNQWPCATGKPTSALWGSYGAHNFGLQRPRVHRCKELSSRYLQTRDLKEEKTATTSPIIDFVILRSLILDSGRPHFTRQDLDHAIEIASGLNHRPPGKTKANLDHTIETSQARPIDQPSSSQARTSL